MKKLSERNVFALRGYTVKIERGKFYVAPTLPLKWCKFSGPYKSLQHATMAIARKLQREFLKRGGNHVS